MNILKFHLKIKKIIKNKLYNYIRELRKSIKFRMSFEKNEKHENQRIPSQNYENHKNLRITCENIENHEHY